MNKKEIWNLRIFLATVVMGLVLLVCLAADKPSRAELTIIAHAREHRISASAYPDVLVQLLERNPETEEFVLDYPFREPLMTDLSTYDCSQGVPLLMQWDKRWGYTEYGGTMAAVNGSAPLCLSMAGYYLTGDALFYPGNVLQYAIAKGYDSAGTAAGLITEGAPALGLGVKEVSAEADKVRTYLNAGNLIIAALEGNRFVVLTGWQEDQVSVNDPDSYVNSGKAWPFEELKTQIRNLWVIRKPTA